MELRLTTTLLLRLFSLSSYKKDSDILLIKKNLLVWLDFSDLKGSTVFSVVRFRRSADKNVLDLVGSLNLANIGIQ